MAAEWWSETSLFMYQITPLHVPEDGILQGEGALPLPAQKHQSAPDNDPAKLGTVSISNSSRVSEVHGDHTLAPSGHATKLTWMQSTHYTCFVWQAICNSAHHTHIRSVGMCIWSADYTCSHNDSPHSHHYYSFVTILLLAVLFPFASTWTIVTTVYRLIHLQRYLSKGSRC